ncbi:hypothetical protein PUNSTDRAFT_37485, partial [Punctularia strigosozonata HHB-11173 SS5]
LISLHDSLAQIHPYAKMAWSLLSAIPHVCDESIQGLVETLCNTFAFIEEVQPLSRVRSAELHISYLVKQTLDCAYFLRAFTKIPGFWTRAVKNRFTDIDSKIAAYQMAFSELRSRMATSSTIRTEITVNRVLGVVDIAEHIATDMSLSTLPYAKDAGYNSTKRCHPDTRTVLLDDICSWINDDESSQSIYLLLGQAGSGKSAVAHSIAARFKDMGRLGSVFCFNRSFPERTCALMFPTIARNLAAIDPQIRNALSRVISLRPSDVTSTDIETQFESLVLLPTQQITLSGPIVIVIDALDESGTSGSEDRRSLLSVLANRTVSLPRNLRIIVTARPEDDIHTRLVNRPHIRCKSMGRELYESTRIDIYRYIRSTLQDLRDDFDDYESLCWRLAELSEGLFQFAFTVCTALTDDSSAGTTGEERMDSLFPHAKTPTGTSTYLLDDLYTRVLASIFNAYNEKVMRRYRSVMQSVLAAREPLSIQDLTTILANVLSKRDLELILRRMGSLLTGIHDTTHTIRPIHTSFRDFLLDRHRGGCFYVDITAAETSLAAGTMTLMRSSLHFNMCNLQSSYTLNHEQGNSSIDSPLAYACRYWAQHLARSSLNLDIISLATDVLREKSLFWLEALSLLNSVDSVFSASALLRISDAVSSSRMASADILRFTREFGVVIRQSAPHIYLSALAFAPLKSRFPRFQFPGIASVVGGADHDWPHTNTGHLIRRLLGHTHAVLSVAFSRDGSRIVSGSQDHTVRLWNLSSGEQIGDPYRGHTDDVRCVAFSPDNRRVVSGSWDWTIRLWDSHTGLAIGGPLERHTDRIMSIAFASDGSCFASLSADETVRIWNEQDGMIYDHSLADWPIGKVCAIAFLSDGERLVLGSRDGTVQVWNVRARKPIGETMQLPEYPAGVRSMVFSPDGTRSISGSHNSVVHVWDTHPGYTVRRTLEGHSVGIQSVIFSPCGSYIVSGSSDSTVRIWNARTGESVGEPLVGHRDQVNAVAISSDGACIVSASDDSTVRLWRLNSYRVVDKQVYSHNAPVWCVAFSPDGTRVASGSLDKTIRVFDVDTGHLSAGPFTGHSSTIRGISFSRDGARIIACLEDSTIRLWNARSGARISLFRGHSGSVHAIAVSHDGMYVVSGSDDCSVRLWEADSGKPIGGPWRGHDHMVTSVAFSPDGTLVASGSTDWTVRLWDVATGRPVGEPLRGHSGFVYSVAFSTDGTHMISGSDDGNIHMWDVRSIQILTRHMLARHDCAPAISLSPRIQHSLRAADQIVPSLLLSTTSKYSSNSIRLEDGWILGPQGERLLWVPVHHRDKLWPLFHELVIPTSVAKRYSTHVDLSRIAHGTHWQRC